MTSPHVFEVTTANFEDEVLKGPAEVPILLDFWADWCEPCKVLTPLLEKIATSPGSTVLQRKA